MPQTVAQVCKTAGTPVTQKRRNTQNEKLDLFKKYQEDILPPSPDSTNEFIVGSA